MGQRIAIGSPVNKAEELAFNYLEEKLPQDYIFFTNLTINQSGEDYDFDAIVLGRHALYVVEIKGVGGEIIGDSTKWEVIDSDGVPYRLPRNPLQQANMQAKILHGKLAHQSEELGRLYVQDCVCLVAEEQPHLQIDDDDLRLKKVRWYKGIEQFLTDPAELLYPRNWSRLITDDITRYHQRIKESIIKGFKPVPIPRRIREFKIEGKAWSSTRYRAYLASREKPYPSKNLLKVYQIPSSIKPEDAQKFTHELARELTALNKIRSEGDENLGGQKNVVIGIDAFALRDTADVNKKINQYVVVMEWVDGQPLSELIGRRRFSLRQKYQIATQVCRGLAFAHTANVVHRNLNPANVILDRNGIVKIVNFDFAKFLGPKVPMGTIGVDDTAPLEIAKKYLEDISHQRKYIAPEILPPQGLPKYHDMNKATDLYALGIVLYELFLDEFLVFGKSPDLKLFAGVSSLDPQVADWIGALISLKPEERTGMSLSRIAEQFASLAQDIRDEITILPELKPGDKFKKYKIERHIAATSMSDVYQAMDPVLNQKVLIKLLRATSDEAIHEMLASYRAWQEIDPKYTGRWLDWDTFFVLGDKTLEQSQDPNASRFYYQVLEYIEGENLRDRLRRDSRDADKLTEIALQIVQAVAAIHAVKLTHRDIKPENIILAKGDLVKIIDFGLSQRADEIEPVRGVSPGYTPPEVIPEQGRPARPWTYAGDVYSAAGVLAFLFCGEGSNGYPNADSQLLKERAGSELTSLILRDLDNDPQKRHKTAMALLEDMNQVMDRLRSDKGMPKLDYPEVLARIEALTKEAEGEFDHQKAGASRADAALLREWLQKGKTGECPVDVNKYVSAGEAAGSNPAEPVMFTDESGKIPTSKTSVAEVISDKASVDAKKSMDVVAATDATHVVPVSSVDESRKNTESTTSLPKETSDEDSAKVRVLSPEERTIRKQLMQVRAHLNHREWRKAFALASLVGPLVGADMKDEASQLLDEARRKRDIALEADLKEGDSAFETENKELARRYYESALLTDPDNEHAKSALRHINGKASYSEKLSKEEIAKLKVGLKDRRNLKRLGEAVYEAEAVDAEEKLTPELSKLLPEAREAYNALRVAHGEETTMMRFGDLSARKNARERIASRVQLGELFIYDATLNENKDSFELLQEAEQLLRERSRETAQYEIDIVNLLLPGHPLGAQKRLEEALSKPFHEEDHKVLEKEKIKITGLVEQQRKAQEYLSTVAEQKDEIKAFALTLLAQSTFPYEPGIDAEVSQAQTRALNIMKQRMEEVYGKARDKLSQKDFADAQELISQALALVATWPQEEKPERLDTLIREGGQINEQIIESSKLNREFDKKTQAIREQVADPYKRGIALEQFEQLRKDSRFADWPELRLFVSEMDSYRGIDDQLKDAEEARGRGDWQRVHELTSKIKDSKKAGELGPQVDKLFAQAEQELKIEEARWLLESAEVKKANNILTTIIASEKDEARRISLKDRLANETKIIDRAISDTPPMQGLYDRAGGLQTGSVTDRLEALKIYRYVGGVSSEQPQKDWPVYCLSLRTADARKSAASLAETIHNQCLTLLQDEYARSDNGRNNISDELLRRLSPYAAALREGYLIYTDDEKALVHWVEVEWGKRQAKAKEAIPDWKSAVEIWKKLDIHFPETPEVETGLRNARIKQTVMDAGHILHNEHDVPKAVQLLQDAQGDGLNTSWEILLSLAEAYSLQSEFDKAFGVLTEAGRFGAEETTLEEKRLAIEQEQVVYNALSAVENKLAQGSPREALIVLRDALDNPVAKDSRRLRERRDQIFLAAQDNLLGIARKAHETGMDMDKIKAVTVLVDLRELEELSDLPKNRRRSDAELASLSADLSDVVETLVDSARRFSYQFKKLDVSISEADLLLGRLQTFMEITPFFASVLSDSRNRLESRHREIKNLLQSLGDLRTDLNDANQETLWENALLYNSFDVIDEKLQAMNAIGLDGIPDLSQFDRKLQEWKDIHTYLIDQIQHLKELFSIDEDFDGAVALLRRLSSRPDLRPSGQSWQSVQQKEYKQILNVMDHQFRVVNLYGDDQDLIGRQAIETECRKRSQQLNLWLAWDKECLQKMEDARNAVQIVEKYKLGATDVPLLRQRQEYQSVQTKSQVALDVLNAFPEPINPDDPDSLALSGKVRKIQQEGKKRRESAERWNKLAIQGLNVLAHDLDGLVPTEEQFKDAVALRDWDRLERLLGQADRAGTLTDIDRKRVEVYRRVLQAERQRQQEKRSWRDRFKLG
jgi:serine/threonine protein kinase